jgi:thiamine biosynthesis lipoprotein
VIALDAPVPVAASRPMMGGDVAIHVLDDSGATPTAAIVEGVLDRLEAWAGRLTRFDPASELMRLNASPASRVPVGPTLTAVLDWARTAEGLTDGLVDVALLDARLAAEAGTDPARSPLAAGRRWSLGRGPRGAVVRREPGVLFDLDGVAKGWLADRALAITPGRSALVDGDGDVALRIAPGDEWAVGIADPRQAGTLLATVRVGAQDGTRHLGLATSGTSNHRWAHATGDAHHLIDPRTLRSADTDIVQATVLAGSAREAEAFAKTAVIAGSARAFDRLARPGVYGVLVLTTRGEIRATPEMLTWLG